MRNLTAGLIIIGVITLALIISPSIKRQLDGTNDIYQAQQRLELQQAQFNAQIDNQRATTTAPAQIVLTYALIMAGIIGMFGTLWISADAYQQRRVPLVKTDAYGRLPLSRATITDPQRADQMLMATLATIQQAAHVMIAQAEAQQRLAERLTLTLRDPGTRQLPHLQEVQPASAPLPTTPTFSDLVRAGEIHSGRGLILGYEDGQPIRGTWKDLYSTALAGMSGTGKTTTQRWLAAQTAIKGARFVIIDPHRDAEPDEETGEYAQLSKALEPLRYTYLCEPAATDREVLDAVRFVADIGQRRINGEERNAYPVIAWLDEVTSLLGRSTISDELAGLLEKIAQEYRKVGVFASLSGQIWTSSRAGGTELRDSLASVICHRMKPHQARLLLSKEDAAQTGRLAPGQAVLWRTTGESHIIMIPNTTPADLMTLEAPRKHYGSTMEAPAEAPNTAVERPKLQSPDDERLLAQFLAGKDISTIAKERTKTTGGRPYTDELQRVNNIIRTYAIPTRTADKTA